MMANRIGIHRLTESAKIPTLGTEHSACHDLYADIPVGKTVKIYALHDHVNKLNHTHPIRIEREINSGSMVLLHGERALIPTGIVLDLPENLYARVYPRSGSAWKNGLTLVNSTGIIDPDYTHELFVPIINLSGIHQIIVHGERIAQVEICERSIVEFFETGDKILQKTDRKGGFGSTGSI